MTYCRDGEGGFEDSHGVTCREFGPHKVAVEKVLGHAAVAGTDLERLGDQVDVAQTLFGPRGHALTVLTGLASTLTGVGEQLEGTVTEALTRAETAETAERAALGREAAAIRERDIANSQAAQAVLDRDTESRNCDRKVREADGRVKAAEAEQKKAERAQHQAEGERTQHEGRATRAEDAAAEARTKLADLTQTNTALTTEVAALKQQLHEANNRADSERQRAEDAVAETERVRTSAQQDAAAEVERARQDAEARVEHARQDADRKITEAHAEIARQADTHADVLLQLGRDHTAAQTTLAGELATATAELTGLQRRVRDGLARLQRIAAAAVAPTDPVTTDLRHGVEDLLRDLDLG